MPTPEESGFKYDLFISYAHDDNADPENWVHDFTDELRSRLKVVKDFDKDINLFIDKEGIRSKALFEQLTEILQTTRFLIPVLSRKYVNSDYCMMEYKTFLDEHGLNRMLVAEKIAVKSEKIPDEIVEFFRYQFFEDVDGFPMELRPDTREFDMLINRLAHEIAERMEEDLGNQQDTSLPKVFVAHPGKSMQIYRQELVRDLKARSRVFPPTSLPRTKADFKAVISDALEGAELIVLPVSNELGSTLDDDQRSKFQIQYDLARNYALKHHIPVFAWKPKELGSPSEDAQKEIIESMESDRELGMDWVVESRKGLVDLVFTKLDEVAAGDQRAPVDFDSLLECYVISTADDADPAEELVDELFENDQIQFEPRTVNFQGDVDKEHEHYLRTSEYFLIYHKSESSIWWEQQVEAILQKRGNQPSHIVIYNASGQKIRTRKAEVIAGSALIDDEGLEAYVNAVKKYLQG